MESKEYDIVIIGSGMGGLLCADILSREGFRVCVLEKNKQIGGCLQTFVRDKTIFDSGVHYIGGLGPGQNLFQIFKYLGIIDKLKLQKLEEDCFDKIMIGDEQKDYVFAQGYENFISHLVKDFPGEEKAIRKYCDVIRDICSRFPLYNLRDGGDFSEKTSVIELAVKPFIESLTNNQLLREVLVGNSMLYVLDGEKTPFYVHAMILNSYIESSWKCVDGGSIIARLMAKNIRAHNGVIITKARVDEIIVEKGMATSVRLENDQIIKAKRIISNIHPAITLKLAKTDIIRHSYRQRLESMENGIGGFQVNIVFKKNSFPYNKHNYYFKPLGHAWDMAHHTEDNWPLGYALFFSASSKSETFADSLTILACMRFSEVERWAGSFNTVADENDRGEEYDAFKQGKAELLIDLAEKKFPGLRNHILNYYTSTPLTYRDYIGSSDGSMYGIVKDAANPMKTFISSRTKVPNLFLTGQNLNLHGVLGTAMSGLVTCASVLESEEIIKKIRNA